MTTRSLRALVLAGLVLVACSSDHDKTASRSARTTPLPVDAVSAFVAHRDARLASAPSFVWLAPKEGVRFDDVHEAASASLLSVARAFGLSNEELATVEAPRIDDVGAGAIIAQAKQSASGVEIFRGRVSIALRRDLTPVAASGLLAHVRTEGAPYAFERDARAALAGAFESATHGKTVFSELDPFGGYERFAAPGLAQPARVKKVLYPQGRELVPAYYVELPLARAVSFVVAASDGRVLETIDLVKNDAFSYRVFASADSKLPFDGPQGNAAAPYPAAAPNGTKVSYVSPELVTLQNFPFSKNDPWLLPDAVTTAGNNVRAYADLAQPDGPLNESPIALTGDKSFDYAYDTAQSPGASSTNIQASATQLFYVTNFLHDWFYDAGFDEKSGNHQNDNFGRGGIGRDALRAEAQDYSGRNNANAQVPPDGSSPIIQMYVFSGPSAASLEVTAPANIAGSKSVGLPGFGLDAYDTTGSVVLGIDDQGADASDACESLTNNVSGKIVLVHRGVCSFVQKAQNVQAAGGIGAIVVNVPSSAQPTVPPYMGGTADNVNIPVLSLALADGQALEAAIPGGVTVTMHRALQTDLDGGLDTMIVAHEWGHVLSGRLVHDGVGLNTNQARGLGEGWGDFTSLMLGIRADDVSAPGGANWSGAYQNGAYATIGQGADFYFGIRRLPYSVDFAKNPLTFKHIANGTPLPSNVPISYGEDGSFNAEVHAAGEVWASMLLECYVSLLRAYPFGEAQERMKRYLVASMKLTPSDPTFLEARDAVLAAAYAADEKDYRLFWEAFGRRGAGVGAEGPGKESTTNQGVKESYFVGNDVAIFDAKITDDVVSCDHDGILDEGEIGTLSLSVRNAGPGVLSAPVAKLTSPNATLKILEGAEVKLATLKPFEATKLAVRAQISAAKAVEPITIDVTVVDPSFPDGRTQKISVITRYGADESGEASTIDRVDTKGTSWSVTTTDTAKLTTPWARVTSGLDGKWFVPNGNEVAEHRLVSPPFTIDGTTFELSFKHRWSFRFSTRRQADMDGGVVEVSVDGGKTWKDISAFGAVDYTSTLDESTRATNPLKGRKAYGNRSKGYPDAWVTSRIAVDLKEHPEAVQVRFLMGSGTGFSGAPGWEIDEIALAGVTSQPFWGFVPHGDYCDENGPTVTAPPGKTVKPKTAVTLQASGAHPAGLPLTFVWTQVAGPPVELKSDGSPKLDFVSPDVKEPTTVSFHLRAHDGSLLSAAARVDVAVTAPDPTELDAGGGACGCRVVASPSTTRSGAPLAAFGAALGALALAVRRRRRAARG